MTELVLFAQERLNKPNNQYDSQDDFDTERDLIEKEFPDFTIYISLDYNSLSKLDNKMKYRKVYFNDHRLSELYLIPQEYPTYRQILNYIDKLYTDEILEDHRFLERFEIVKNLDDDNYSKCILQCFWGS